MNLLTGYEHFVDEFQWF